MNYAIIFYTLGVVIDFSAAFMLPPFIVALLYRETDAKYFLLSFLFISKKNVHIFRIRSKSGRNSIFFFCIFCFHK